MASLPAPSSHKENEYVTARVRERCRALPPQLCWIIVPIAAGIVGLVAASELRRPIPFYVGGGAVILGVVLGGALARNVPEWNATRRARHIATARQEFHDRFATFAHTCERMEDRVRLLKEAVAAKSYGLYLKRAKALEPWQSDVRKNLTRFYDNLPDGPFDLAESGQHVIAAIESDPNAVAAYEPRLFEKIERLRLRAVALNTIDCYRASREIEPLLAHLASRSKPFNFAPIVRRLQEQVQEYRDYLLADPGRARLWSELLDKDERLDEDRRHNEAMEEAAEARAEAAREQTRLASERNDILRQQRNAQGVSAAGTVATAYYTRRSARAAERIARKVESSEA